jgi:site-specific DNA-methyltransferase (cytosine-N4-specific)
VTLDNIPHLYDSLIHESTEFSRKLVSFQANKPEPYSRWFPYKEGFSRDMVSIILSKTKNKKNLLDPFAGTGTALLVAAENNIAATGIELLPLGRSIFEAITTARNLDPDLFRKSILKVEETGSPAGENSGRFKFHHIKITEKAFPPESEEYLNSYLAKLEYADIDPQSRVLLRFAVMASLERMSYTRKDGQFLRWDSRSGKTHGTFQKPRIYPFKEALDSQLRTMIEDMYKQKRGLLNEVKRQPRFIQGSALRILPTFEDESFDIIITSPPYCNRYDYTRTYALELAYLGVDERGIRELRQELLSNTVENKEKDKLLRNIYEEIGKGNFFSSAKEVFENNVLLQGILSELERKLHQNELNNPGIFSLVRNYFFEHAFIIGELSRILESGGEVYYVNDNVRYAGINIPVDFILADFAESSGLFVDKIYKLRETKGNSSQQMKKHGKVELRKCVYHWVKK